MASAKRKLFGHVAIPEGATHACVHRTKENGRMMGKLKLEIEEGVWADAFPIDEITRSWVTANFGEGVYRISFVAIDKRGGRTSVPPASGAIDLREPAARAPEVIPAVVAPAPAQLDVGALVARLATGNEQAITPLGLLQVVLQVQEAAEARAQAAYERQTERDRAFVSTLLQMRPAAAPEAEEDDDDEDDDDDMATKIANAVGEQLGPFTKAVKGWAEKGGDS